MHLVWGPFVAMEEKFKGDLLFLFTLYFYLFTRHNSQFIRVNLGFWPGFLSSQPELCA